jgi:hypothetical protein
MGAILYHLRAIFVPFVPLWFKTIITLAALADLGVLAVKEDDQKDITCGLPDSARA